MRFFAPAGLWFLGLLVPILLLYILRLRRRTVIVSSVAVWDRVFKREVQSALWRKIKRIISLLLNLAMAALLALAIARPFTSDRLVPQRQVIVLDASASMTARLRGTPPVALPDEIETPTRFDAGLALVRAMIDDMSVEDRMMLLRAGPRPSVLAPMTGDRDALRRALDRAAAGEAEGDLRAGIELAFDACRSELALLELERAAAESAAPADTLPEFEVWILSDGGGRPLDDPAPVPAEDEGEGDPGEGGEPPPVAPDRPGRAPLRDATPDRTRVFYVPLGDPEQTANVAISAFSARRRPRAAGDLAQVSADFEVLATIRNYGDAPVKCRAELELDGELFDDLGEFEVGARSEVTRPVRNLTLRTGGVLEMRVHAADDPLAVDDRAFAIIPEVEPASVLLVQASGDIFLQNALAFDADVRVEGLDPAGWPPKKTYDVTIFEGFLPETLPPGNIIMVAPRGEANPFDLQEAFDAPVIKDWDRDHPVLAYVVLENAVFLRAQRIDAVPRGWEVIASAFRSPLILVKEEPERRLVYLGFSFTETDLVLRPSFPILISNMVQWLREKTRRSHEEAQRTGHVARVRMRAQKVSALASRAPAGGGDEAPAPPADGPPEAKDDGEPPERVSVIRPDGSIREVAARDGLALYTDTEQLGVYVLMPDRPEEVDAWAAARGERGAAAATVEAGALEGVERALGLGSVGFLRAVMETRLARADRGRSGPALPTQAVSTWPAGYRMFAANLLSEVESDARVRPALGIGETVLQRPSPRTNQELQLSLLWAALALLALEWLLYNVGIF